MSSGPIADCINRRTWRELRRAQEDSLSKGFVGKLVVIP
jgi:hypothetical protein